MYKLLIVDDEPLVQIGIKSILNWNDFGIEICGTAVNGKQAFDYIQEYMPEIVITDIRMPIMSGLELIKNCRDLYGKLPLFIILTSYEDFSLIKEAIKYGIIDYLVKLELTADSLKEVLQKALQILEEQKSTTTGRTKESAIKVFHDKFFISLLHNLFKSNEEFQTEAQALSLDFTAKRYAVSLCNIIAEQAASLTIQKSMELFFSATEMVQNIVSKYIPCYCTSLDTKHFCIIFLMDETDTEKSNARITEAINAACNMIHNYFNVWMLACVGKTYEDPLQIADSYENARQIANSVTMEKKLVLFDDIMKGNEKADTNIFNLSIFKASIRKAFEEYDSSALSGTISEIIALFRMHPTKYLQALDAACNILYLSVSLLTDGEKIINEIFSDYPDGYHSIYRQTTMEQLLSWLEFFSTNICMYLQKHHKSSKEELVDKIMDYINDHIEEKLTLNEIASEFGITPNYLSLIFKKESNVGFSEYITSRKISKAKQMMVSGNYKIYEIADQLGFENAFYFSKVFKKVEGCSPRDYLSSCNLTQ
ncbi:response regulator transcription factor [Anaerosporobacter faecicola]|uniref:response regulator transcription factor n=1 Tax=Anaerosporobacter faecicola TaxID=2718714 RepID=UPI00143C484A|nr:response regulator [Anaerosporobacter faecicola]